jgi:endonuclease YncB( thermonuclease family)
MQRSLPLILILLITWVFVSVALSDDLITAKVVGVADGDSITALANGNRQVKIRLHGIDCPEGKQAFGKRAKQFTSSQCFSKTIRYREVDTDRYGRTVATVYLDDGRELNLEILKAGLAWHYKRYSKRQDYADAENQARTERLGLWADKNPTAPWQWRRERRNRSS